jgi:hypothetical protein
MLDELKRGALYGAIVAFAMIIALSASALWYSLHMPGRSHSGDIPPALPGEIQLAARLKSHVVAIATRPHNVRHYEALEAAAAYIEQSLQALGYRVVTQTYEVHDKVVRNLEVTVEPTASNLNTPSIIVGAHYDSAGNAPGANDNGSGVAATLELARLLANAKPKRRLRFVLFVNEEPPYFQTADMGSERYAGLLDERREHVAAMLSLETLGYYSSQPDSQNYPRPFAAFFPNRADFIAFVGMPGSRNLVRQAIGAFRRQAALPSIGGVAPAAITGVDWSDHGPFAQRGHPAIMITDTALFRYPHYHRPTDTPDKLDYERLARVTLGLEVVIRELAEAEAEQTDRPTE